MKTNKLKAFTLSEILVVLIIIGILTLIALPNLMPLIGKARSVEAQTNLNQLYNLQKAHHYMNTEYSGDLAEIGFEPQKLVTEGGQAFYRIEISDHGSNSFTAKAIAVKDFDGDGVFNTWQIDQDKSIKEILKD